MSYKSLVNTSGDLGNGNASNIGSIEQTYEELMQGSVPCPTCRGTGRIPSDQLELVEQAQAPDIPKAMDDQAGQAEDSKPNVDPMCKAFVEKVKEEIRKQGISQTVFAAVAFNRTQGLLSEYLKRVEYGEEQNKTVKLNMLKIQEFLSRPLRERQQAYRDYMMESPEKRRLRQEYYESDLYTATHTQTSINAHARGVMMEYFNKIGDTPDHAGYEVLSEVLNLDKDVIQRFFKAERFKKGLIDDKQQIQKDQQNIN